jgi:murein DD-endopeptidase MepM/ murein hydrolase activator NlpD
MRFDEQTMAGDVQQSVISRSAAGRVAIFAAAALMLVVSGVASSQSMYKYRGDDGEWIYSDRPPDEEAMVEVRDLEVSKSVGIVDVTHEFVGQSVELTAHNELYAPVELTLEIKTIQGLQYPHPDQELRWVLPPKSDTPLFTLDLLENRAPPFLEYQFRYLAGDPSARHRPGGGYRAPFAVASNYPITQAFPEIATHTTRDSQYAVDVAMPIGTDIFAARDGVVFDVASNNFTAGLDPQRDGPKANVVRVMHDDGTYAVYAHLNTNTIRVRPGDRVRRGEYIADSGNTGFSSGPHLHFAVLRNAGMRIESVPVTFTTADSNNVVPSTGAILTAH